MGFGGGHSCGEVNPCLINDVCSLTRATAATSRVPTMGPIHGNDALSPTRVLSCRKTHVSHDNYVTINRQNRIMGLDFFMWTYGRKEEGSEGDKLVGLVFAKSPTVDED